MECRLIGRCAVLAAYIYSNLACNDSNVDVLGELSASQQQVGGRTCLPFIQNGFLGGGVLGSNTLKESIGIEYFKGEYWDRIL